MKISWAKIAGVVLPLASAAIAMVSNAVEDQKMKKQIAEEVKNVLKEQNK